MEYKTGSFNGRIVAAQPAQRQSLDSSNITNQAMKRIISSVLVGVILYFLLPLLIKFIPHYRLAVWSITAALVSLAVSVMMDKA